MGSSASAVLAYGYNLGGKEYGFNFVGTGDPWYEKKFDVEHIEELLLAKLTEFHMPWNDPTSDSYSELRDEAWHSLGLEVVEYGILDMVCLSGIILATKVHHVDDFGAKNIQVNLDHSAADRLDAA